MSRTKDCDGSMQHSPSASPLERRRCTLRARLWHRSRPFLTALISLLGLMPIAAALELEDQGTEVEALQQQLQAAGYYEGPITGYFGPRTQEALIQFQQTNGLTADGVVGPETRAALGGDSAGDSGASLPENRESTSDPGGLTEGSQGPVVSELQTILQAAGYLNSNVTGYFGPETTAAVRQFQTDNGLTVDGIAGPQTLTALNRPDQWSVPTQPSQTSILSPSGIGGVLQRGTEGDRVQALQEKLGLLGFYRGANDGRYDVLTEAAVLEFQQANQLTANGIADSATLTAIDSQVVALARQSSPRVAALGPQRMTPPSLSRSGMPAGAPQTMGYNAPATGLNYANPAAEASTQTGLRPGAQGQAVRDLQERLYVVGVYGGPANGFYGPDVEEAVKRFQRSQGLTESGIADTETLAALENANLPSAAIDDSNVLEIQQRLQDMELYTDSLDGIAGPNTEDAIRDAQRQFGINPSDIIAE